MKKGKKERWKEKEGRWNERKESRIEEKKKENASKEGRNERKEKNERKEETHLPFHYKVAIAYQTSGISDWTAGGYSSQWSSSHKQQISWEF